MELLVLIRWFHALAASAWVGGTLFYLFVLNPALAGMEGKPERAIVTGQIGKHFQELTQACVAVVLLTGAVLTFDRLSQPHLDRAYVVVLAIKIAAALLMVGLASGLGRKRLASRRRPRWLSAPYLIMALGLLVYLLAILLQVLFDISYGAVS